MGYEIYHDMSCIHKNWELITYIELIDKSALFIRVIKSVFYVCSQ